MASRIKKIISYIIPPLVTVGLCYVLYSDVDLHTIYTQLSDWNYPLVALFLGCNVAAMLLRGLRWRLQLCALQVCPSFGAVSRSIFGCYAVNMLFPRLGEVWRCAYISKGSGKPFSGIFGTMVADRIADTITVFILAIIAFVMSSSAMDKFLAEASPVESLQGLFTSWPVIVGVVLLLFVAAFILFSRHKFAVRMRAFIVKTWRGFAVVFKMPKRGQWLILTIGIWGCYILSMYLSMLAFAPTAALVTQNGMACVLLTFVFGSLSMAIPSNGGIGPWQLAIIMSLSGLYGMSHDVALGFATVNLAATSLLTIILGIATFLSFVRKS